MALAPQRAKVHWIGDQGRRAPLSALHFGRINWPPLRLPATPEGHAFRIHSGRLVSGSTQRSSLRVAEAGQCIGPERNTMSPRAAHTCPDNSVQADLRHWSW